MELYIIRHGQSTNNALADPHNRVHDPSLTDLGKRQADAIANFLIEGIIPELAWNSPEVAEGQERRGYGITHLYCSLMRRTLQTAQPIGQALGLNPEGWIDIHEQGGMYLDHGAEDGLVEYPGMSRQEILDEFPNYVLPEKVTEEGWWQGGYEDMPACQGRAIRVAQQLREWSETDQKIAFISHGTFIDNVLKALFNQMPGDNRYFFHYNTAVTRVDFHANGFVALHYMNRVDHLSPELISY